MCALSSKSGKLANQLLLPAAKKAYKKCALNLSKPLHMPKNKRKMCAMFALPPVDCLSSGTLLAEGRQLTCPWAPAQEI